MENFSREAIYQALFALWAPLLKTASPPGSFTYATRRQISWTDIPDRRPAIIQWELPEDFAEPEVDVMQDVTLHANIVVVAEVSAYKDDEAMPAISVLNGLVDSVQAAIRNVDPMSGRQTLGGKVQRAFVQGRVLKFSGDDDGTAVALIPVKMLVPA